MILVSELDIKWIIHPAKASYLIERGIKQFYLVSGIILSYAYEIKQFYFTSIFGTSNAP